MSRMNESQETRSEVLYRLFIPTGGKGSKMRRIFLVSALTVILLMKVNYTFAERPFSTEDAGVAGKGVFQLELGAEYVRQSNIDK